MPAPEAMFTIAPPRGSRAAAARTQASTETRLSSSMSRNCSSAVSASGADRRVVGAAGVVHPDVQPPQLGDGRGGQSLGSVAAQVGRHLQRPAAAGAHLLGHRGDLRRTARRHHDVGPRFGKRERDGPADPAAGAGDHSDPAVEPELVEDRHPSGRFQAPAPSHWSYSWWKWRILLSWYT